MHIPPHSPPPLVFRKVSPIAFQDHPRDLVSKPVEVPVRPRGHYPSAQRHGVDGHPGELGVEVVRRLGALSLVAAGVEGGRDTLRQQGGPIEAPEKVVVHHLSRVWVRMVRYDLPFRGDTLYYRTQGMLLLMLFHRLPYTSRSKCMFRDVFSRVAWFHHLSCVSMR